MQNQRRSHSLQPTNRALVIDPNLQESPSLVSTNNLATALQQTATLRPSTSSSFSSSSPAPSLKRSPPVGQRTTSRPSQPPAPPPGPPPYTRSTLYCQGSQQAEQPWIIHQWLETLL